MGRHDTHLPRKDHNRMVESKSVSTSEKERKGVAAEQGWGTKADAKMARSTKPA